MSEPMAYTVHDGHGTPPAWRQQLIAAWLTANDVDPNLVSAAHPVTVLMVPFRPADAPDGPPWMVQVIVLHQYYVRPDGAKETDLLSRRPVTFQRTVPLKVPFPADTAPGNEGATRGETQGQTAQEAPQEVVRPAREAGVSDPRQGSREVGPLEGQAARNEGATEEGPRRGDEAVPELEEVRRRTQEEVNE